MTEYRAVPNWRNVQYRNRSHPPVTYVTSLFWVLTSSGSEYQLDKWRQLSVAARPAANTHIRHTVPTPAIDTDLHIKRATQPRWKQLVLSS